MPPQHPHTCIMYEAVCVHTVLNLVRKLFVISHTLVEPTTAKDSQHFAAFVHFNLFTSCQKALFYLPVKAELIFLRTIWSFRHLRDLTAYLYRDLAFKFVICDNTPLEGQPFSNHIRFQNCAFLQSSQTKSFQPGNWLWHIYWTVVSIVGLHAGYRHENS